MPDSMKVPYSYDINFYFIFQKWNCTGKHTRCVGSMADRMWDLQVVWKQHPIRCPTISFRHFTRTEQLSTCITTMTAADNSQTEVNLKDDDRNRNSWRPSRDSRTTGLSDHNMTSQQRWLIDRSIMRRRLEFHSALAAATVSDQVSGKELTHLVGSIHQAARRQTRRVILHSSDQSTRHTHATIAVK